MQAMEVGRPRHREGGGGGRERRARGKQRWSASAPSSRLLLPSAGMS